jgi:hypothetical protein
MSWVEGEASHLPHKRCWVAWDLGKFLAAAKREAAQETDCWRVKEEVDDEKTVRLKKSVSMVEVEEVEAFEKRMFPQPVDYFSMKKTRTLVDVQSRSPTLCFVTSVNLPYIIGLL